MMPRQVAGSQSQSPFPYPELLLPSKRNVGLRNLGRHRRQDSLPAAASDDKDDDTDNDYTIDDTSTAQFLFLVPPHNPGANPSAPTQAGVHVENAENAQEEACRSPSVGEDDWILFVERQDHFHTDFSMSAVCAYGNAVPVAFILLV